MDFIEALPPPSFIHTVAKVGITNEEGLVHREVILYNLLEMMTLAARLNTVGYRLDPSLKDVYGGGYAALFSRSPPPGSVPGKQG